MHISDSPREECGIIGLSTSSEAATSAFYGLYALQHRGQEAAGIAVSDGQSVRLHKGLGLVSQVFKSNTIEELKGTMAIGHTRYSTTGSNSERNVQPYLVETIHGPLGLAHNGNLVNTTKLRQSLLKKGLGLQSSSDSEVMALMLVRTEGKTWEDRLMKVMPLWQGAYSLVLISGTKIIAARDPWGFRPLSIGRLPNGGYAVASESGAIETIGGEKIREVKPGEIVVLKGKTIRSKHIEPQNEAKCTFEHIYFSRPDSFWDGLLVHKVRQKLGEQLAKESRTEADIVISVPDSSIPAAIGYSRISQIPYSEGFVKNRYIGRTFIEPTDELRNQGVKLKFNVLRENVNGLRVIVIDDSIVRGNTAGPLVKMIREAGAREVHVKITCPPIAYPCFFGVDMGTQDELISHHLSVEEIKEHIDADSLNFLSIEGMAEALQHKSGYCNACFTGKYPIPVKIKTKSKKKDFENVVK